MKLHLFSVSLLGLANLAQFVASAADGYLRISLQDAESSSPYVAARVHLKNAAGQTQRAADLPYWHDHFVCNGQADITLAPGRYFYEIERGPEYQPAQGTVFIQENQTNNLVVTPQRLVDLKKEGWWSGDLHVHRPFTDAELLLRAEDLHVAPFISWWNKTNPWKDSPLPGTLPISFPEQRYAHPLSGEDERDGGALLFHNMKSPLDITPATRHYPSSLVYARQVQQHDGAWIDIEKPFWWDLPMWVAQGVGDSIGIAHNHMQRGGVLGNEAWGRPRDLEKYPGPQGNGRWTQDLYYHLLNCGLRLPPSAGSASGVLPNPVGYNRVYVHLDGPLDYGQWWEGLRAGRSFVSNGPLLRCRANGQWPGTTFRTNGPLQVLLEGQLDSRDPIASVELVVNGKVDRISLPSLVTIAESGWFLVRAIADITNTFRFASTAPFYVEIGSTARPVRKESAQFFLDWSRERLARLTSEDPKQQAEVRQPWQETIRFWQNKVAEAEAVVPFTGEVVDAETGAPLPARVYIQSDQGRWLFPESSSTDGSAVRYQKQNWVNRRAMEMHTTLSAHPFQLNLAPGRYTVTVERGKEYRPLTETLDVGTKPVYFKAPLHRWVNMARRGWYSGETHVHRTLAELPNVMLAEDLNVAFPLTYWVTKAFAAPTQGDKNTDPNAGGSLMKIDDHHVIYPRNTEYEIFTVGPKRHTLGAVFVLHHRSPLTMGAPPVGPVAEQAHREGALLDLDKHDWPWSMALIPSMKIDLFELGNNHMWRTEFGFTNWNADAAGLTSSEYPMQTGGERAWMEFGFQNYYALLNCGFQLRPTAGTASGVHPVPLGFSRVYVHMPDGFEFEGWVKGLDAGRSFVTTGPMLLAEVDGKDPGTHFDGKEGQATSLRAGGLILSETSPTSVEIVVNGKVLHRFRCLPPGGRAGNDLGAEESIVIARENKEGAFETRFMHPVKFQSSGWMAIRCWEERPGGRVRFAHTAPWFIEVPGQPLLPSKAEAEYLVRRVQEEIARSREVLPAAALAEYEQALQVYQAIAAKAKVEE